MMLITLAQAKAHMRVTHNADDESIVEMIEDASAVIVVYLGSFADTFLDTSGVPAAMTDTDGMVITGYDVPGIVRQACKRLVAEWYANRDEKQEDAVDSQFGYGYLSPTVTALLYPLRVPVLA